ncbi:branched-chain amino acid ABC transporter permease [Azorhizobium oxalatiphilum]|uniref:Branched-chain amino acid ABC transporter permease n=1 Tax=Azorhizobium oxalatiphilum TaxID=980631 RepID=A0A917BM44_9HYPH|nr:branched-chain amino acid ABC transporter permease [Azorhizobium oxalatiphilum]GGF51431.1 branched-chain amino acid ABC transporter permease [Azorhizobium oxalatiphilum]
MSALSALPQDLPPLLWSGLVSGCLYGLGALGLVMVFKSSKVVNFAHGNLAGLAAFLVYGFSSGVLLNLSWGSAVALALGLTAIIGVLGYAVIAPLVFKSDLTSTIATLGIGLILQGTIQIVFGAEIVSLELPIPSFGFGLGSLRITAYDLTVLAVTALMIGGLFFVIERTRLGIAFRAVCSNPFASRVCGLNLRLVHLFSWVSGAVLGLVAALLIVPTTFLSSTTVASFMLTAFTAAVVGGFSSLPGAAVGGIVVGIAMNLFSFYVSPEFMNTFLLGVIMLTLNFFPDGLLEKAAGGRV